ncbi:MAG: GWxTD domain-containing protein [Balneolaceae bacterium]
MNTRWIPLLLLLLAFSSEFVQAQRSLTYPQLVQQNRSSVLQEQAILFPSDTNESLILYTFRASYEQLPFRRSTTTGEDTGYESELRMDLELRDGDRPVARESWTDTVRTATYEETQEESSHVEGTLAFRVPPGEYQLYHAESTFRRVASANRTSSGQRNPRNASRDGRLTIQVPEAWKEPRLLVLKESGQSESAHHVTLMNMGTDARYGEVYTLMVLVPPEEDASLTVRIRPEENRTDQEPLFEQSLTPDSRIDAHSFELLNRHGTPKISIQTGDSEAASASVWLLPIPNENWPSRPHRIELLRDGESEPVARQTVTPRWANMPVSLLNLDVAIDMLRFILPEDPLREIKRGSAAGREQAWLAFWKERDPTPDTEYNELMVEYYRRIDHAWETYTTPEQPGYESDQGRTWIRLGPPERTERRYPPGQATQERWYYPDRVILFEATTGFGDFRRIGVEER